MMEKMIAEYQRIHKKIDESVGVDVEWLGDFSRWFDIYIENIVPKNREDRDIFMDIFFADVLDGKDPEECTEFLRKYIDGEIEFEVEKYIRLGY